MTWSLPEWRYSEGEGCGKGSVAGLGGLSRLVGILPFNFCCSVCTLCLFGMCVVFETFRGVCA